MIVNLEEVSEIVNDKKSSDFLDDNSYVTTENMLTNREGVKFPAKNLPKNLEKVNSYKKGDILISNIRPYFKKIWLADRDGTSSGDVLIFRSISNLLLQEYLYLVLQTDVFFNYMTATSTGTKMPRGNKEAIKRFKFHLPNIEQQKSVLKKILLLERKVQLNNQINANLVELCQHLLKTDLKLGSYSLKKISDLDITVSDHVSNGSFKALKENVSYFDKPNYALFLRNIDLKKKTNSNQLKYIDKPSYDYLKKSHLFGGEVVISNVADVGTIHRVPKVDTPMVLGNNQIFISSGRSYLTDYLYVYFKSLQGQSLIKSITSGSAQQKFNKTDFRNLEIPLIDEHRIKKYITPLLMYQDVLNRESTLLNNIKTTLLKTLI